MGNESIPKIIMPFHIRAIPLEDSVGMHIMGQTFGLPNTAVARWAVKQTPIIVSFHQIEMPL